MPDKPLKNVASKYHLTVDQVHRILELLDQGFSIPYIRRYHKELAANLGADDFYELVEEQKRLRKLETRRHKVLNKLEEREVLTDELRDNIEQASSIRELIDYYVPYRPRKRSRSRLALSQGLRPLAEEVLSQAEFIPDMSAAAEPYLDPEGGLDSIGEVLEGVFHIVSDWVAEEKSHRDRQREVLREHGELVCSSVNRSLPGRLVREFKQYFSFRRSVSKLHPYHMLLIRRGKRLKALEYRIEPPLEEMDRAAAELYMAGGAGQYDQVMAELGESVLTSDGENLQKLNSVEFMVACIRHSLHNVLSSIVVRELDRELARQAEKLALSIIRRNVKSMLMVRPVPKPTLAIHPGYRTGCNLAALDAEGKVLATTTVYPHAPQRQRSEAVETICLLVKEHELEVAAIGDGTACEETEELISEIIAEKAPDLRYTTISEVGLDSYATSRGARNELSEMDADERCAVSIGRRLVRPLSELVKINPRQLCPEPYPEDVNGGALKTLLELVIEECVCAVGVDANRAHYSLLRYVCGLDPDKSLELVSYRDSYGPIKSRKQLRQVPKIDRESFDQAAGFLKIEVSDNPLDVSRIHPRFYPVAERICEQLEIALADLAEQGGRKKLKERRSEVQLTELEKEFEVHYLLLKDIIEEMVNPWSDPREEKPPPLLRQRRLSFEDLEPDQWLKGTVRNIVDFGAFVDVGVGEDGLIHISELSDGYVETPYDVLSVGDTIRVRVVSVDEDRSRIALSLREESERPERRERRKRSGGRPRRERREEPRQVATEVPGTTPTSVRAPKSTIGSQSRRVQKAAMADRAAEAQKPAEEEHEAKAATDAERAEEHVQEEQPAGGLLDRLDFANIERRGKPSSE